VAGKVSSIAKVSRFRKGEWSDNHVGKGGVVSRGRIENGSSPHLTELVPADAFQCDDSSEEKTNIEWEGG